MEELIKRTSMNQKELKFKTNLNCGGCVSKVKLKLDTTNGIAHWEVDTEHPNKILVVNSTGISKQEVISIIEKKGFTASDMST